MAEAIVMDGGKRGQVVKVCADPACRTHHPNTPSLQQVERERAEERKRIEKEKLAITTRHRVLATILQRVSAPLKKADLLAVAQYPVWRGWARRARSHSLHSLVPLLLHASDLCVGSKAPREMPRILMYIVSNLLIALLSAAQRNAKESLRRARDDLKRTVQDLQRSNEALHAESRERKLTEQALLQAQSDLARTNRVSSLGELTASIAHEVKQPIAAAITDANTCLRWLSRDQPDLEEARAAASRIVQDGNRASEIVNRIRLLFKKDTLQRELVDRSDVRVVQR
jgi:C4-dicarboxylate-specific signal transduction histidine kinase